MAAGKVEVVFSADTSAFTADVKRADDAIVGSARAMEDASRRLERAWNRELVAQDRRAQKAQETARAQELAALKADLLSRSLEEQGRAAEALARKLTWDRELQEQDRFAESTRQSARAMELAALKADIESRSLEHLQIVQEQVSSGLARWVTSVGGGASAGASFAKVQEEMAGAGGHSVSSMQASSAALRLLEGGFSNNLRAAERFLGTTLGLGPILEAAFPIVGAVALGGALFKMGEEAYNAEQNIVHLKEAIEGLNQMQITVDKNIAAAGDSIEEQVERVLEKTQGKTASLQQKYTYQNQKPVDLSEYFYDDRIKKLPDDVKTNYETLYKSIAPADLPDRLTKIRAEVLDLQKALASTSNPWNVTKSVGGFGPDATRTPSDYYKARLIAAQQIQSQVESASDLRAARGQGAQMDLADEQQRERDDAQQKAKEAAEKGAAATKAADQLTLKAMEAHVAEWKTLAPVSSKAIYDYWDVQRNAFVAGSAQYNAIVERQAVLAEEGARKAAESIRHFLDQKIRMGEESSKLPQNPMGGWNRDLARAAADKRDAANEASAQNARNAAKLAELQIEEQSGRTMTQNAAAAALATVHTQEYGAELERLQARLREIQSNDELSNGQDDKEKKTGELEKQIAQTRANRSVQVLQDQYSVSLPDSSGLIGARDALNEFVDSTRNASKEMKDFLTGTLTSLNRTIITDLTSRSRQGPRHLWTNLGKDVATNVTGAAVSKGEGALLGMLGFGSKKAPTGAAGDPFHTISDNVPSPMDGLGTLGIKVPDVVKGLGDAGLPGGKGGIFSSLLSSFIPGFADGVSSFGGGLAMVGEQGPELVNLPRGSSVTPNHRLPDVMGGSGDMHIHVNAQGSTDPAQTEAAVRRGIYQAAPHIVAAGQYRSREAMKRSPSTRRG